MNLGVETATDDSHVDSPVVGSECVALEDTGKFVGIHKFPSELRVPVFNEVVTFDDEHNGKTYIFTIYNALYIPKMKNILIVFMLQFTGIDID